jgi:hypothetical protein
MEPPSSNPALRLFVVACLFTYMVAQMRLTWLAYQTGFAWRLLGFIVPCSSWMLAARDWERARLPLVVAVSSLLAIAIASLLAGM